MHSLVSSFVTTFYHPFLKGKIFPLGKISTNLGWMRLEKLCVKFVKLAFHLHNDC